MPILNRKIKKLFWSFFICLPMAMPIYTLMASDEESEQSEDSGSEEIESKEEEKPESKEEEKPESKEEEKEEPKKVLTVIEKEPEIGIDTVDIEEAQGNWLFKRIWWSKAEKKYEKIRKIFESVLDSRSIFIAKRAEIKKSILEPFYISLGLSQQDLQRLIEKLLNYIADELNAQEGMTNEGRKSLEKIKPENAVLKRIKSDLEDISRIETKMEDALRQLAENVQRVRKGERDAWDKFKDIAEVLDDIKARKLFYEIDFIAQDTFDVQAFILGEFTQHFDQFEEKIKKLVERIKESIESLKNKDIDLEEVLKNIEAKPAVCEVVQAEDQKKDEVQGEGEEQEDVGEQEGFIRSYILNPINKVIDYIGSVFSSISSWFTGLFKGAQDDSGVEEEEKEETTKPEKSETKPEIVKTESKKQEAKPETPETESERSETESAKD